MIDNVTKHFLLKNGTWYLYTVGVGGGVARVTRIHFALPLIYLYSYMLWRVHDRLRCIRGVSRSGGVLRLLLIFVLGCECECTASISFFQMLLYLLSCGVCSLCGFRTYYEDDIRLKAFLYSKLIFVIVMWLWAKWKTPAIKLGLRWSWVYNYL